MAPYGTGIMVRAADESRWPIRRFLKCQDPPRETRLTRCATKHQSPELHVPLPLGTALGSVHAAMSRPSQPAAATGRYVPRGSSISFSRPTSET